MAKRRQLASILMGMLLSACAFAAGGSEPVAHIDGKAIGAEELAPRAAAGLAEQQQAYDKALLRLNLKLAREQQAVREEALDKLIEERVLALEAAASKSTPEALLAKLAVPAVTDADVRKFFDANQARISEPFEAVQERIRSYLQKQAQADARSAFITALRANHHVVIDLPPLREQVSANGPVRGPGSAPVTIVEFSDFQCPYCGRFAPVLKQLMDKYPNDVRLIFRHMPLTGIHPNAQKAAEAAVCAQNQGKFWEMHDVMFAEQSALDVASLKAKARRIGLDAAVFDDCLDGGKSAAAVAADVQAGESLGIGGTPASLVNGRFLDGAVSVDDLEAVVKDELRRSAPAKSR